MAAFVVPGKLFYQQVVHRGHSVCIPLFVQYVECVHGIISCFKGAVHRGRGFLSFT